MCGGENNCPGNTVATAGKECHLQTGAADPPFSWTPWNGSCVQPVWFQLTETELVVCVCVCARSGGGGDGKGAYVPSAWCEVYGLASLLDWLVLHPLTAVEVMALPWLHQPGVKYESLVKIIFSFTSFSG